LLELGRRDHRRRKNKERLEVLSLGPGQCKNST
jgi:hypothetical protein